MADFTLSPPGSSQSPWTPPNVLILNGTLAATTASWKDSSFTTTAVIHNVNYGSTIVSSCTFAISNSGDDIFLGSHVRTGANAACMIGVWITNTSVVAGTFNFGTGTFTTLSAASITRANGDVFVCTVAISGGTATISATQNGSGLTFTTNTTTTFASEPSLAAGHTFFAQNSNGTFLNQFTGTGVVAGAVGPRPSMFFIMP